MAEKIGSVWAIDIGNTSLKALRLSNESGTLEVIGFDHIQHRKSFPAQASRTRKSRSLSPFPFASLFSKTTSEKMKSSLLSPAQTVSPVSSISRPSRKNASPKSSSSKPASRFPLISTRLHGIGR